MARCHITVIRLCSTSRVYSGLSSSYQVISHIIHKFSSNASFIKTKNNASLYNTPYGIYKDNPSPRVDAAWEEFADTPVLVISREDVLRMGKDPDYVGILEEPGKTSAILRCRDAAGTYSMQATGRSPTHTTLVHALTLWIANQRLVQRVQAASRQRSLSTSIYQPLRHAKNEIRLILIAPGQKDDKVACRLEVVSLDQLPRYDTLSYTWGNPETTSEILVNDNPVSITATLHNALHSIRHPRRTVTLWADGLCIDQGNNAEKSTQVAMMDRIYAHGRQTWISLGSPGEDWADGTWSPPSRIDESFPTAKCILRYVWSIWWHNIMWRRSRRSRLGAGHLNDARRQLKTLEGKSYLDSQQRHDHRMAE